MIIDVRHNGTLVGTFSGVQASVFFDNIAPKLTKVKSNGKEDARYRVTENLKTSNGYFEVFFWKDCTTLSVFLK